MKKGQIVEIENLTVKEARDEMSRMAVGHIFSFCFVRNQKGASTMYEIEKINETQVEVKRVYSMDW